jgi:hypothetical protein
MKDEDEVFRKHILGCVQLLVFSLALILLAMVYYTQ